MNNDILNNIFSDFIESSRHQLIMRLKACDSSKRVRSAMSPTRYEELTHNGKCRWNASEMAELLVQGDPIGEQFLLETLSIGRDLFFKRLATEGSEDIVYEMT